MRLVGASLAKCIYNMMPRRIHMNFTVLIYSSYSSNKIKSPNHPGCHYAIY